MPHRTNTRISLLRVALAALVLSSLAMTARADSVAQIASSVRISRGTATLIDPQGRPGVMGMGTDTVARPGDVLTFIAQFTPVPNGDLRGLGGYVTVYVPRNTEVVGARLIDSTGATVPPHRGGLGPDGVGPRGTIAYAAPLVNGSLSQLYADTGIFYSVDRRTSRMPTGSMASEVFLTIFNGLVMNPAPTATGQLAPILGANPAMPFAHNQWDLIQAYGFGVGGGTINPRGQGNTPDMYGSAVAGPDTWYPHEASYMGPLTGTLDAANVVATGTTGPWQRIRTLGAEIGRRGVMPPVPDPGMATRIGIPAVDGMGRPLGIALSADAPLPAYDTSMPSAPYTRALRFAVGELAVGHEYLSEFSLRVLDTPLDPVSNTDTVCAEVFGGDSSAQVLDGTRDGKDNTWRYFLPAPACVALNLLFDIDVDRLVALAGDRLTYTINAKNLSTVAHDNVVVRHCYTAAGVTFLSASAGGVRGTGTGCPNPAAQDDVSWTIPRLDPGEELSYTLEFTATGGGAGDSTIGRAIFTSDRLPYPGFQTVAFTVIGRLAVIDLGMTADPDYVATPPGTVTYTATVSNSGTGPMAATGCRTDPCRLVVTLPPGFVYVAGSTRVGAAAVADPAIAGSLLTFTGGLTDIPPGGAMTLTFRARIPAGTPDGIYTCSLESWLNDTGWGITYNDAESALAEVVVGAPRSEIPTVRIPLLDGATEVCGTAEPGATVRIYVAGLEVASGTADGAGAWCVGVPRLYSGQRVTATAQAPGEVESLEASAVDVLARGGTPACSDGIDNDLDGLTDFPDDPDCDSAADTDEAHQPECSDGIDNDGDGDIDFGADLGCSSLIDDTEAGMPQCSDGIDNDGDGLTDFPDDPGCSAADDVSESDLPQCADGEDNDGDGLTDFPFDTGCASPLDDDERAAPGVDGGAGVDAGVDGGPAADGSGATGDGGTSAPPDWGGVDEPGSGCGCVAARAQRGSGSQVLFLAVLVAAAVMARRRRRH